MKIGLALLMLISLPSSHTHYSEKVRTTVPRQYQAPAQLRMTIIESYEQYHGNMSCVFLRNTVIPSLTVYDKMIKRIIPEENMRTLHQTLINDAALLKNAFVNLANAYDSLDIIQSEPLLNQFKSAVARAIEASDDLWNSVDWQEGR